MAQEHPKVQVKRSSAGLGLFAKVPFKKGEKIIEYIGRPLTEKEQFTSRSRYLFGINDTEMIDGSSRDNLARYCNHSCRPNCETDVIRRRVYIYAKRNIKEGEELTYNYGKEYVDQFIKPEGCRCEKCKTSQS